MNDEKKVIVTKNGVGFLGILGLIFITLKLCGVINWSWWLVLLPIYGPIALVLSILAVVAIVGVGVLLATFLVAIVVELVKNGKGG